jgi:hypothetical protein
VYEERNTNSQVLSTLRKGERLAVGQESTDDRGAKWVAVETNEGVQGFVVMSSISVPRLGSVLLAAGILVVVIAAVVFGVYKVIQSGVSVSRLAMIVLGVYGAYLGQRKLRQKHS